MPVTPRKQPALLGRNWLRDFRLSWKELQYLLHQVIGDAASMKDQFHNLFQEEPGKLKGFKAHLKVELNAVPIVIKSLPVSYYMQSKLDAEYKCVQDFLFVAQVLCGGITNTFGIEQYWHR